MYTIEITKAAKSDVEAIINWYETKKTDLGNQFLDQLNNCLITIQKHPKAFPVKYAPYHEVILKQFPYVLSYIIQREKIVITAVMGAKQHPLKKYRKK